MGSTIQERNLSPETQPEDLNLLQKANYQLRRFVAKHAVPIIGMLALARSTDPVQAHELSAPPVTDDTTTIIFDANQPVFSTTSVEQKPIDPNDPFLQQEFSPENPLVKQQGRLLYKHTVVLNGVRSAGFNTRDFPGFGGDIVFIPEQNINLTILGEATNGEVYDKSPHWKLVQVSDEEGNPIIQPRWVHISVIAPTLQILFGDVKGEDMVEQARLEAQLAQTTTQAELTTTISTNTGSGYVFREDTSDARRAAIIAAIETIKTQATTTVPQELLNPGEQIEALVNFTDNGPDTAPSITTTTVAVDAGGTTAILIRPNGTEYQRLNLPNGTSVDIATTDNLQIAVLNFQGDPIAYNGANGWELHPDAPDWLKEAIANDPTLAELFRLGMLDIGEYAPAPTTVTIYETSHPRIPDKEIKYTRLGGEADTGHYLEHISIESIQAVMNQENQTVESYITSIIYLSDHGTIERARFTGPFLIYATSSISWINPNTSSNSLAFNFDRDLKLTIFFPAEIGTPDALCKQAEKFEIDYFSMESCLNPNLENLSDTTNVYNIRDLQTSLEAPGTETFIGPIAITISETW